MMKKAMCGIFMLCAAFFFAACGDDDKGNGGADTQPTPDETTSDEIVVDEVVTDEPTTDEGVTDETTVDETPDVDETLPPYPKETPTSNQVDDIAANFTFFDHEDKEWTLGHFYEKKKLIWLIFSAYDCPYCNVEKNDLPALYKADYVSRGLEIIFIENGLLSGPQPSKEPAKIAKLREIMIDEYGDNAKFVYGYLKMDMQSKLAKYIQQGYPVNALIDGTSMKILNYFEGWDSSLSHSQEMAIQFWLDEL